MLFTSKETVGKLLLMNVGHVFSATNVLPVLEGHFLSMVVAAYTWRSEDFSSNESNPKINLPIALMQCRESIITIIDHHGEGR